MMSDLLTAPKPPRMPRIGDTVVTVYANPMELGGRAFLMPLIVTAVAPDGSGEVHGWAMPCPASVIAGRITRSPRQGEPPRPHPVREPMALVEVPYNPVTAKAKMHTWFFVEEQDALTQEGAGGAS